MNTVFHALEDGRVTVSVHGPNLYLVGPGSVGCWVPLGDLEGPTEPHEDPVVVEAARRLVAGEPQQRPIRCEVRGANPVAWMERGE